MTRDTRPRRGDLAGARSDHQGDRIFARIASRRRDAADTFSTHERDAEAERRPEPRRGNHLKPLASGRIPRTTITRTKGIDSYGSRETIEDGRRATSIARYRRAPPHVVAFASDRREGLSPSASSRTGDQPGRSGPRRSRIDRPEDPASCLLTLSTVCRSTAWTASTGGVRRRRPTRDQHGDKHNRR